MASVNKVILVGNLGRDPEMRYTPAGAAVCNLVVATSRSWKSRDSGEKNEETEWHRVVLFDRLAEVAGEYLKKGRPVYVEGRLKTRKWQDKEGRDAYTTEIVAEAMQLLGGREGLGGGDEGGGGRGAGRDGFDRPGSAAPAAHAGADAAREFAGRTVTAARPRPARAAPAAAETADVAAAPSKPLTGFDEGEDDVPF